MNDNELSGIIEIRENHRKRLLVLEKRQALQGIDTDPSDAIEIEDIRLIIEEIDRKVSTRLLEKVNWSDAFVDKGDGARTIQEVSKRLTALGQYMVYREDSIRRELTAMYKMIVDDKEKDAAKRIDRQRVTNILYLIIIVLLIVVVFK